MRKVFLIVFLAVACCTASYAQTSTVREAVDSVVFLPAAALDSTLFGKDIFKETAADIHQSDAMKAALSSRISKNKDRTISGYRVRIYFDNKQDSRTVSENVAAEFASRHPGIKAYRTFANPFFKVAVGDFRTKSEAMALLQQIKAEYPSAFVVKDNISYPVVDKEHSFIVDTITVYRPKAVSL